MARILGAEPSEVIFTSGGTEANNLAMFGLAGAEHSPGHVVSSPMEHPAIAEPVARLEGAGFAVDRPRIDTEGLGDPIAMASTFRADTRFATLMLANNETGAIQPVAQLAELANAREIPVHTDAVQAVGRITVDFRALGVATLAASAPQISRARGGGLAARPRWSPARLAALWRGSTTGAEAGNSGRAAGGGAGQGARTLGAAR